MRSNFLICWILLSLIESSLKHRTNEGPISSKADSSCVIPGRKRAAVDASNDSQIKMPGQYPSQTRNTNKPIDTKKAPHHGGALG